MVVACALTRMLKPVEKQRVAAEVAEQLRELILTGQYPPDSKLPAERQLAQKLCVNRASLREALKQLEHLGLVRTRHGAGTRVNDFMQTAGIELVEHLLPVSTTRPALIHDLLALRRVICRELARLAAARADPAGLAALRAVADRADKAKQLVAVFETDFEFYVVLSRIAGNQVMQLLLNTMHANIRSFIPLLATLGAAPELVRKHERDLIAALERADIDGAFDIADAYLELATLPQD
jgi:fatty acid metabolism transcriptional regulator FadR